MNKYSRINRKIPKSKVKFLLLLFYLAIGIIITEWVFYKGEELSPFYRLIALGIILFIYITAMISDLLFMIKKQKIKAILTKEELRSYICITALIAAISFGVIAILIFSI